MRRQAIRRFVRAHRITARMLGELRVERMIRNARASDLRRCMELVRKGSVFIDVGASVGDFCLAACRRIGPSGLVLALEANPAVYQELVMSTRGARVAALNLAASDHSGWATLQVPVDRNGSPMAARSSLEHRADDASMPCVRVRTVRLDDLVSASPAVSAIKIDVEGHELKVLKGTEETLARDRPALVVEIEARHLVDHEMDDVIEWMSSRGYDAHGLDGADVIPWSDFDVFENQTRWLSPEAPRVSWRAPRTSTTSSSRRGASRGNPRNLCALS